ncbi:MAG: tetratricopeptide repeat protein [Hyphomicrobium sp.]
MATACVVLLVAPAAFAKDVGPADARCDGFAKSSAAWTRCATTAAKSDGAADSERFYAGYWLAKSGSYRAALDQLRAIARPDVRTLTYIGFSYRKLGDMDAALTHYARALGTDPNFTVARAYLGEAYLTLGRRDRADAELAEIETRCGRQCAEYADLAGHIAQFDQHGGTGKIRG